MALFDLGTPTPRRGQQTPKAPPARFRPIGRMEGSDPEIRALYERQKKQWEKEVGEERKKDKETKKAYESQMKSQYGNQWRKRVAEQGRAKEYAAAQQALDERATVNRGLRETELPPMPEKDAKGDEMVDIPGGGKASADTVRMLYGKKQERDAASEKTRAENRQKVYKFADTQKAAAKQRYEEELASRGFTPPKTREEENEYNRERMDDFRESQRAKKAAQLDEASFLEDAKRKGIPKTTLDKIIGGDSSNVSVRRKYFEGKENQKARDELKARAEERRARNAKQTTANPEAASYDKVEFTPKSTAAPIGVGTESLEYGQRPSRADATQQPFGMVPPQTVDRGVDFGTLSEANVSGSTIAPTTSPRPTPESATATPTAPRAKTSKEVTQEDIQPGISEVRMPPKAEGESVSDYNKRANEEYDRQVIIPSFDEGTRGALLTARQLNSELEKFRGVQLVPQNRPRIKKIKSDLEKPKEAIKDKIKELRVELRRTPGLESPKSKFIRFQIETLKKELGTIERFLT